MPDNEEQEISFTINNDGIKQLSVIYSDLGMVYYEKKDFEKAILCLDEAIRHFGILLDLVGESNGDNQDVISSIRGQINELNNVRSSCLNLAGDKSYVEKDYFKALEHYKKLLMCDKNETLYLKIAKCLMNQDEYAAAANFLNDVITLNSQNYEAYILLGDIFLNKFKVPDKALELYKRGSEIEGIPAKLGAYPCVKIAHIYSLIAPDKSVDEQIKYLEKALQFDSESESIKKALENLKRNK